MRTALDTNTSLSGIIRPFSVPARALHFAIASCVLLLSDDTFQELASVVKRAKFDRYLPLAERLKFLDILERKALFINVLSRTHTCRDPQDDKFVDLAIDGDADFLVSGDQDLLCLTAVARCRIVNAADFLLFVSPVI